jgi:hypothetical protein
VYKLSYRDTTANSNAPQAAFRPEWALASSLVVGIILSLAALQTERKPALSEIEEDLTSTRGMTPGEGAR